MMIWLIPQLEAVGVKWFESWNEANVIHEWCGSWEEMILMHSSVYKAVKKSNKSSKILSPSSTTWDFDYIQNILESKIAEMSDGIAFHGYTYNPNDAYKLFYKLDNMIEQSSNPKLSLFLTEVGFRYPAFTEKEQAEYFAIFTLYSVFIERIKLIAWFKFQNLFPEDSETYDQNMSNGYAMIGHNKSYARESAAVFSFLNQILNDLDQKKITKLGDTIIFAAEKEGKKVLFIAGNYSRKPLNFCYDIFGNTISNDLFFKENIKITSNLKLLNL